MGKTGVASVELYPVNVDQVPLLRDLIEQLDRLNKKPPISGFHETYGLLTEEVDEFFDEVKKKTKTRDLKNAKLELMQIAALCIKAAADLKLNG